MTDQPPPRLVKTRYVVHINGFEPVPPERLDHRMQSGLRRFAPVWGATATCSEPVLTDDGRMISWHVETSGPNWSTTCHYVIPRWDHLVAPYVERSWSRRMIDGYGALLEFARTGTIVRYFKTNIRYGLFVIYPFLLLLAFAVAAVALAWLAVRLGMPYPLVSAPLLAIVAFVPLLRFLGGYFYLDFALSDWAFAADLARRDIPALDDALGDFSREIIHAVRESGADEVVLSGVSLGAVMMVEALARAYAADPNLRNDAAKAAFLTVGSSILKIGLHPAAEGLRRDVGRIGSESSLLWAEYQAKVDFINFYKTDPVARLGLPSTGRPSVRQVRIRDMMSKEDYRKAQRSLLLLHRQFVLPNAQRYFYDFYHINFGPLAFARRLQLGPQLVSVFGEDGGYLAEHDVVARPARGASRAAP